MFRTERNKLAEISEPWTASGGEEERLYEGILPLIQNLPKTAELNELAISALQ